MKIRLLLSLAGLAFGFAVPSFAQQTSTPDPQLREQFVALGKKVDEAWNNNDAAALSALYMEDAVIVRDTGPVYGRKAIEKWFADLLKQVHISNHLAIVDQDSPHIIGTAGNEIWGNGEWSQTLKGQNGGPIEMKGYFSCIAVREGDAWKFRMETWNITPAPAATAQTNATPAQEKSMVDPEVRQQIEALFTKFQEAFNNRDGAAIAAMRAHDAIEVRSWQGVASGQEALKKRIEADFATSPGKMVNKLVALYPIGSAVCEIADSDVGGGKAQTVTIYVREGDTWKASMTYVNNERVTH